MRLRYVLPCIAIAATACALFPDNSCGPESRTTTIGGDVRDAEMAIIGHVLVHLIETHGGRDPLALTADFGGLAYGNPGPLLGHVQGARLITASGDVLRVFTIYPGNSQLFILTLTDFVKDAGEFQRLRSAFLTGHVLVELTTDLPGLESLRVPLPLQEATDWRRSPCT